MIYGPWLYPAAPLSWLAAPWACVCGAAASGAWTWRGASVLRLVLGLLLTGPQLGLVCDAALTLRSKRVLWLAWALGIGPQPQGGADSMPIYNAPAVSAQAPRPGIPYTLPGSASHRVSAWLLRFETRWKHAGPRVGRPLVQWFVAALFSLVVALELGQQPFMLTAAGLAIVLAMGLGLRNQGPAAFSILPALFAWCLGHATHAALTPASVAIAASFGWTFYACQQVDRDAAPPVRQVIPQASVACVLVATKQPIAAAIVASLALPNLLLWPLLEQDSGHSVYFRALQVALAASMAVAALAAGYRS